MHGYNDQPNHPIYAPGCKNNSPYFFGKSRHPAASFPHYRSFETLALEDHLRELFQRFTRLSEKVISDSEREKHHELKLNFPKKEEFEKLLKNAPATIQALAYFELACSSYDDLCHSTEQVEPSQRFKHLLLIQEALSRAIFHLETAQNRSIKARIAGRKSHEQSEIIKAKALRLLDELCPTDGWRSMSQAAKALDEKLRPIVAEQRGRLNPHCLEDRLLGWLRDTADILNPKYHQLRRKHKG